MDEIYERLANKLNELPHGFPRTASGVELRILAKIFSPEDAAMALNMLPLPETAEAVAGRLSRRVEELRPVLDGMVERGQIASMRVHGERVYMLAPFVVGIYEFQLGRMDAELAAIFEEYAPVLVREVGGSRPALARVVPVNVHIDAKAEVLRYESVREMLARGRSFRLMECICRKEQGLLGHPCSHTLETCLAFSPEPDAYDGTLPAEFGRSITQEEAYAVLDRCEREGLVHCTYNLQSQHMFVCNCCSCCCGFLRGVRDFGAPHLLVRSNFLAAIDGESCAACGDCTTRCPMDAITEADGSFSVLQERCIGCGVCTLACPTESITLVPRPAVERTRPPKDVISWALRRSLHRSGPLRTAARFGSLALAHARSRRAATSH